MSAHVRACLLLALCAAAAGATVSRKGDTWLQIGRASCRERV